MTPPWPVAAFIPWSMVVPCTAVRDWGWAYGIDTGRSTQVYRSTQDEDVHACICPYIQYVYLYV